MASKLKPGDESGISQFSFGRGRGLMGGCLKPRESFGMDVGASPVLPAGNRYLGLEQGPTESPGQMSQDRPHHSTPYDENATLHQLTDMISLLGSQIGESITASLVSNGVIGGVGRGNTPMRHAGDTQFSLHNAESTQPSGDKSRLSENTHVNVVVRSDKEPVIFRGDNTDKYTVEEWVELMKAYIRKQKCDVSSQIEVVMGRLMGKARDVVKVGLRSDPSLQSSCTPEVMYIMLTQYFSNTSSCLPLQDFYSTLPNQRENPVDYWLRLNKAADVAEEGLKRQGRRMEDMGGEISKMFVKHCPDLEFASVFKHKQIHEWSTKEVQERVDEYQREQVSSVKVHVPKTHAAARICHETHTEPCNTSDMETSCANVLSPPAISLVGLPSLSPSSVLSQNQQHSLSSISQSRQSYVPSLPQHQQQTLSSLPQYQRPSPSFAPQGQLPLSQQSGNEAMLGEMMSMLRQLLSNVQVGHTRPAVRRGGRQFRGQPHVHATACQVCNDSSHSTESHCRSDRLCFTCFKPGHTCRLCPSHSPARDNVQGN